MPSGSYAVGFVTPDALQHMKRGDGSALREYIYFMQRLYDYALASEGNGTVQQPLPVHADGTLAMEIRFPLLPNDYEHSVAFDQEYQDAARDGDPEKTARKKAYLEEYRAYHRHMHDVGRQLQRQIDNPGTFAPNKLSLIHI